MTRSTTPIFLALAAIFAAVPAAFSEDADPKPNSGPGYLLRYQFEKDEVQHYQVDHESSMKTAANGYVEEVKNKVHSYKNQRVISVDSKGNATLELTIDRTVMSAQFGDAKAKVYDSTKPEDCPKVYQHMRGIIGQPLARVQVSPRGELLVTKPRLPAHVLQKAGLIKSDGSFSTGDAQNFLIEFPEKALKVGDGWNDTFQVEVKVSRVLKQKVTIQRRYELVDVTENLATIKLRTGLITPTRDPQIRAQLIQMTPSGQIVFDMEKGRLVSRTLTIDKTEFGVIKGGGSMQAKSKRVERWVTPENGEKVAKSP